MYEGKRSRGSQKSLETTAGFHFITHGQVSQQTISLRHAHVLPNLRVDLD